MNQERNDTASAPQFTQSEMSDLYDPNIPVLRNRFVGERKFQHTENRQRFAHYLSAYQFIKDNKISDGRIERIYQNISEWEVIWPNDGGIV